MGVPPSVLIEGVLRAAGSVASVSVVVAGSSQAPFSVVLALSVEVLVSSLYSVTMARVLLSVSDVVL